MSTVQVKLSKRVVDLALASKPDYDSQTAHLSRLIESALDPTFTLGKPSPPAPGAPVLPSSVFFKEEEERARETPVSPRVHPADPFRLKAISAHMVPDDLRASADLFCEWWSVRGKGAVRSIKVAGREFEKLRAFKPADRSAALQKAIAGGWKQLYEPKDLKSFNTPQEPISNHPAHKVFKADDLGPEWDIPSTTGGKGVLDGLF
jgi:hypothetical protein